MIEYTMTFSADITTIFRLKDDSLTTEEAAALAKVTLETAFDQAHVKNVKLFLQEVIPEVFDGEAE